MHSEVLCELTLDFNLVCSSEFLVCRKLPISHTNYCCPRSMDLLLHESFSTCILQESIATMTKEVLMIKRLSNCVLWWQQRHHPAVMLQREMENGLRFSTSFGHCDGINCITILAEKEAHLKGTRYVNTVDDTLISTSATHAIWLHNKCKWYLPKFWHESAYSTSVFNNYNSPAVAHVRKTFYRYI